MRANGAVQFYGIPAVLEAYENRDAPGFILWWGTQLLHKYEGKNIEEGKKNLDTFLKSIQTGENLATYTLTVYDKLPAGGLNNKTGYDGSFNFKLHGQGHQTPYAMANQELLARIDELSERLNERDTEKPAGIMGMVSGILDNPQVQTLLAQKFVSIMEKILNTGQAPVHQLQQPEQLGKVGAVPDEHNYQEQIAATNQAWPLLFQHDPEIGNHLVKLARIAEKEPGQFQTLINMLDKM